MVAPMTRREHVAFVIDWLPAPLVFLASIPIALVWGPDVGKISWAVLLLVGPVSGRLVRRWASRG